VNQEEVRAALAGVRLMIATPCYGGQVTAGYLQSLVGFTRLATALPLPFDIATSVNESLVTRARNRMVRLFLDSDATHLMFIDADIEFDPFDVFRVLMHDRPVVCAEYPMKGVHFEGLVGQQVETVEQAVALTTRYVTNFEAERDPVAGGDRLRTDGGLVAVKDAGTGFMLIERSVIEQMINQFDIGYESDDLFLPGTWYAVFDTGVDGGRYLSEDYWFCRRWQQLGGVVWLDPQVVLNHVGAFTFAGVRQPYGKLLDG
jgi:hypothetical protein